jgi:hypothetical protein
MLNDLLLHPRTRAQLNNFLTNPKHALLLSGPLGSGKETTAVAVAASIIGLKDASELTKYPYYTAINPSGTSITIDEIRAAQSLLTLKVPKGQGGIRRVISVIDAGRMRSEAQNAFLKTLEEPPLDTCIILTARGESLLPTITSRAQTITILPVSSKQAAEFYGKKGIGSAELQKNYALSQGQAGLLSTLLSAEAHVLTPWVQTAKEVLAETVGRRLLRTDGLAKNKDEIRLLLDALSRIAHSALQASATQNKQAMVQRWSHTQSVIQESLRALNYNASTKLLLDNLFVNL